QRMSRMQNDPRALVCGQALGSFRGLALGSLCAFGGPGRLPRLLGESSFCLVVSSDPLRSGPATARIFVSEPNPPPLEGRWFRSVGSRGWTQHALASPPTGSLELWEHRRSARYSRVSWCGLARLLTPANPDLLYAIARSIRYLG